RERLDAGDTFVFCHVKRADAAGHTKDPRLKQAMIETLDTALGDLPADRAVVCLTGDHATPASPDVIHSGDPVPFVVAGPGVRADRVREFGESTCADGILGHLRGPDTMPVLLNAADRPLFLGSRPTPFEGADGYPSIREPLLCSGGVNAYATSLARLRAFVLTPAQFVRVAAVELLALWLIVGTGAAVRLTDSGLGCRHWPGCEAGHPLPAKNAHAFIEFGNRVVGGVVIAVTLLAWLGARRTLGLPRRAQGLALAIFVGTLLQAPLGYLAVRSDLRWPVVAAHLLLSMLLVGGAVVL